MNSQRMNTFKTFHNETAVRKELLTLELIDFYLAISSRYYLLDQDCH